MRSQRLITFALGASLLLWGCGSNELSMTEYIESVQTLVNDAGADAFELYGTPQGAVLVAEGAALESFTPQDLQWGLEQIGGLESAFLDAANDLVPPESLAEFHEQFFDDSFTVVRVALAERAGSATSWDELNASDEMAGYRAKVASDKALCFDLEEDMHARAERGVFTGTPWAPDELSQIIDDVLGCDLFPEHPENMFRP